MDTKTLVKLNTSNMVEQDMSYQCPSDQCNSEYCKTGIKHTELSWDNIVGYGDFPKGGHHAKMKPNQTIGLVFQCPECGVESCLHATEQEIMEIDRSVSIDKTQSFKSELKALLKKHNASISFSCSNCSDLHGVYDEQIVANCGRDLEIVLSDGYGVSLSDLE